MEPRIARRAVLGALVAGLVAEVLFDRVSLGINVPLFTLASLAAVTWLSVRRRPADALDLWLPMAALAASLGPAVRTDPSVVALDLLLIAPSVAGWSMAVAGVAVTRRAAAMVVALGLEALLAAGVGTAILLRWSGADGFFRSGSAVLGRLAPVVRGALLAVPIVGVFALLLGSADAVFGRGLDDILRNPIQLDDAVGRALFVLAAAWLVGGALALAAGAYRLLPPEPKPDPNVRAAPEPEGAGAGPAHRTQLPSEPPAPVAAGTPRRRGSTEGLIVIAAVDLLFAVFAAVQVVFLFGGADTLTTIGMTYSDYARQGYFQLVAVVALAGLLLAGVHAVVGRTRAFLASAFALLGLTAIILASAALRLRLYQEAYGWTELRFYVAASIMWLAACAAIAAVLLWRDRMRWLTHGLAMSAVSITLGISALGPQAFVTHENLARVLDPTLVPPDGHTGFDAWYVLTLGDDVIPELVASLEHLPPADRAIVLRDLRERRLRMQGDTGASGWQSWNLARERARAALTTLPSR